MNTKKIFETDSKQACIKAKLAVQDTLDLVGGKWKLVLMSILTREKKGFENYRGRLIYHLVF